MPWSVGDSQSGILDAWGGRLLRDGLPVESLDRLERPAKSGLLRRKQWFVRFLAHGSSSYRFAPGPVSEDGRLVPLAFEEPPPLGVQSHCTRQHQPVASTGENVVSLLVEGLDK